MSRIIPDDIFAKLILNNMIVDGILNIPMYDISELNDLKISMEFIESMVFYDHSMMKQQNVLPRVEDLLATSDPISLIVKSIQYYDCLFTKAWEESKKQQIDRGIIGFKPIYSSDWKNADDI